VRALTSHQCGLGSIPGLSVICGLSLLLVLVLAPRGFSPGTPVFPSPQTNISKFQLIYVRHLSEHIHMEHTQYKLIYLNWFWIEVRTLTTFKLLHVINRKCSSPAFFFWRASGCLKTGYPTDATCMYSRRAWSYTDISDIVKNCPCSGKVVKVSNWKFIFADL